MVLRRHKTRLHIGQLVKDTSAKLKQASETDHRVEVSVSLLSCLCAIGTCCLSYFISFYLLEFSVSHDHLDSGLSAKYISNSLETKKCYICGPSV